MNGDVDVPITILIGSDDELIRNLYVNPLREVRKDWPIVEIKDANHITCILKPQFKEEIVASLKKRR